MADIDAELENARATISALEARAAWRDGRRRARAVLRVYRGAAAPQGGIALGGRPRRGETPIANGDGSPDVSVSTEMRQLVRVVAREFVKLEERLAKRIAELETKMLTDGGTWKMGTVFKPGAVVTYDGAMFVAKKENSDTKPGQSDCWRLMHKTRGR